MANLLNGCATIQDAISKYGFPVTVYIHRKKLRDGEVCADAKYNTELHCIQAHVDVPVVTLINANGNHHQIQLSKISNPQYIIVRNDKKFYRLSNVYEYLKENRKKSKNKDFTRWVVCFESRPSASQGISLRAGQYFKMIDCKTDSDCITRGTRKRVKVLMYPSRQKFWLPSEMEGEFRLCDSPRTMKHGNADSILQKNEFPLLIKTAKEEQFSCLYGVSSVKVLISCTEDRSVNVFPARDAFLRDVFPKATPIESFSAQELTVIENNTFAQDSCLMHYVKSCRDLGILRAPSSGLPQAPIQPEPLNPDVTSSTGPVTDGFYEIDGTQGPSLAPTEHSVMMHEYEYPDLNVRCPPPSPPRIQKPQMITTNTATIVKGYQEPRPPQIPTRPSPPLPAQSVEIHEYEEAIVNAGRPSPPLPADYSTQTSEVTTTNTIGLTTNRVAGSTQVPNPRNRTKSRGGKRRKSRGVSASNGVPPIIPRREAKPKVNFVVPQMTSSTLDNNNSAYLKYLCTPMLHDPDDTDPDTESEEEVEEGAEESWSDGSLEDDDYQNAHRIQINEMTASNLLFNKLSGS